MLRMAAKRTTGLSSIKDFESKNEKKFLENKNRKEKSGKSEIKWETKPKIEIDGIKGGEVSSARLETIFQAFSR